MSLVNILNMHAEKIGDLELSDHVFSCIVNNFLFYETVKSQLASRRQGTSSAKNRAQVRGSSRKICKQKGSGGARHGSIRAPGHVHGGKAHPPISRLWSYRTPRKITRHALRCALSKIYKEKRLLVIDDLSVPQISTKKMVLTFSLFNLSGKILVIDSVDNLKCKLSMRNCMHHTFLPTHAINVFDLLRHDVILFSSQSIKEVQEKLLNY